MTKLPFPCTLELIRGDVVLGTISAHQDDAKSPWHSGAFHPSAEFEAVRSLFEDELRLLQANTEDDDAQWDDWEAAHAALHEPGLRVEATDGTYAADEILIHIKGTEAWWRNDDASES